MAGKCRSQYVFVLILHFADNHIHDEIMTATTPTFSANLFQQISKIERNLFQIKVYVTDLLTMVTAEGTLYVYPQGMAQLNRAPTADFDFVLKGIFSTFLTILAGKTVLFAVVDGFDADQDYLSYTWDWGDGHGAIGQSTAHTFSSYGSYNVSLTVWDPFGAFHTSVKTVDVVPQIIPNSKGQSRSSLVLDWLVPLSLVILFWFIVQ